MLRRLYNRIRFAIMCDAATDATRVYREYIVYQPNANEGVKQALAMRAMRLGDAATIFARDNDF